MALKFASHATDNDTWKETVLDAGPTLCVIDAYSKWCGPCDALNKRVQNLYQDLIECAARARASPPPSTRPASAIRIGSALVEPSPLARRERWTAAAAFTSCARALSLTELSPTLFPQLRHQVRAGAGGRD